MRTEVDVDAPRSAAERNTYEWLARVEESVELAHAALLGPQRDDLPQFTNEIESACRERTGLAVAPAMLPRLGALRKRLTLIRSLLRQASAFLEAREQLETDRVLGYTPKGLERAL
jgi:hypothetical protein